MCIACRLHGVLQSGGGGVGLAAVTAVRRWERGDAVESAASRFVTMLCKK